MSDTNKPAEPASIEPFSLPTGMTFNIVKINNYFKLYKSNYMLEKLHGLVYTGSQFEVEYHDIHEISYNILNVNITNEYNFIKREFTDETVEDVAKYIKMLGESMAFFRDGDAESHDMNKGSDALLFSVKDGSLYESLRMGSSTRTISNPNPADFKWPESNMSIDKENTHLNKETIDKIWENIKVKKDKAPESIISGIDYEISNLCPYGTDTDAQQPVVTIHENLCTRELTATHKVLYNKHFYNAILVDKFKYDLLFSSDQVRGWMPEIEVISELYLKDESEVTKFSELIMHEIFYSADDLRKMINFYLSKNNTECPSISAIRKYINANFTLDSDITNRIQFKVLFDDICTGMNINLKYHEAIKRSLPLLLTELGLAKKRYSEGIFWYGLKKMTKLLGATESGKNLDLLTSEIVKLREEQDRETSNILNYVFDAQVKLKKPNRTDNCQLKYDPVIPNDSVSPM